MNLSARKMNVTQLPTTSSTNRPLPLHSLLLKENRNNQLEIHRHKSVVSSDEPADIPTKDSLPFCLRQSTTIQDSNEERLEVSTMLAPAFPLSNEN